MTNTLNITVENDQVISRFNSEGEGTVVCSYVNDDQIDAIVYNHNKSELVAPSIRNAKAIFLK
tara:strand:- start:3951 stop:4139 length:189 start_codon:yes stop_codon:yes gene_type:complete